MRKEPCVYILSNKPRGTLYVGVTSDLIHRTWAHKEKLVDGFSRQYGLNKLVYFEFHATLPQAIKREKQVKRWRRLWKIQLIEVMNNEWRDLYPDLIGGDGSRILPSVIPG